jgi:pilus assembly protein Flp/PilA
MPLQPTLPRLLSLACRTVARLWREERAQGMAEYALLAALVAVAAIGAITLLGNNITDVFNSVGNELVNAS